MSPEYWTKIQQVLRCQSNTRLVMDIFCHRIGWTIWKSPLIRYLHFEWTKKGWMLNGLVFKWIWQKSCRFVKTIWNTSNKHSDFEWLVFKWLVLVLWTCMLTTTQKCSRYSNESSIQIGLVFRSPLYAWRGCYWLSEVK